MAPTDPRLVSARFPRSSAYHPDWVIANASGGANALWLSEWLADGLELKPGLRVLDLGCGRATSSIFLQEECGELEIDARRDAERARLVRQVADAGARSALLVERQQRALVGHVVDEERRVPLLRRTPTRRLRMS